MAVKLADAVAYLTTDDTQLKKGMSSAEKTVESSGGKFGSVLQGIGMSVGLGIAGIAASAVGQVTAFMGDSIGAASDLGETVSKTNVLFGESADQLLAWADTAAGALGQSKQMALDAATTFATFGKAAGLGGDDLVKFSTDFTGLATDLASFNNTTPEEAINAIGAALRGEAEPLRAYGVLLDDASMRQKALEMGIIQTTKEALTPQQKVLAAQALIYEQTSAAQGDFARTSGGLANQQRILDANMANLKTTVGDALLPVMLAFTGALNQLVTAVLPPLAAFIRDRIVPAMTAISTVITATVGPAIAFIAQAFSGLGGTMEAQTNGPFAYLALWFEQNMPRIKAIVQTVVNALNAFWEQHGARITAVVGGLLSWMVRIFDTQFQAILDIVTAVLQVLTGDFEGAGNTIRGIVARWWEFFRDAFNAIKRQITSIDWGAVGRSVVDGIWRGMQGAWGGLQSWFDDRLQELRNQLPFSEPKDPASPLRGLADSGAAIVDQIRSGIEAAGALVAPGLGMQPQAMAAGAGAFNITINVNGSDAGGVGVAARDGVLQALRAAGVR
jgi:phage-related protein